MKYRIVKDDNGKSVVWIKKWWSPLWYAEIAYQSPEGAINHVDRMKNARNRTTIEEGTL